MLGRFNEKNEYEDKEVDAIYKKVVDLHIDAEKKFVELKTKLDDMENKLKAKEARFYNVDEDNQELEDEISELEAQKNSLTDCLDWLDNIVYATK